MENKLAPESGKITIKYFIKEHPEYGEKTGYHDNYEDFGEWICRQFRIIDIIDISDK